MAWGDAFKAAWNKATEAARLKAATLAVDAKKNAIAFLKKKALEAAEDWGEKKKQEAIEWANKKTAEVAEWSKQKTTESLDWLEEKAIEVAPSWAKEGIQDAAIWAKDKSHNIIDEKKNQAQQFFTKKIEDAYENVKNEFKNALFGAKTGEKIDWGDAFKAAWNQATDAARNAAGALATTGAKEKASEVVAEWAREKYNYAKKKATETVENWVNNKTDEVTEWAKEKARSIIGAVSRKGISALMHVKEGYDAIAEKVRAGYNKIKSLFGNKDAATPIEKCANNFNSLSDKELDGKMIGCCDKEGKCMLVSSKDNGYLSQTSPCPEKRKAGEPPRSIVYVNGIQNTKADHCKTLKAIGDSTCANVVGIYNATEGIGGAGYIGDAAQTERDRKLIMEAKKGHHPQTHDGRNPAVDTLSDLIVKETKAGNPPEIWAHSQGGAVTSLALYGANNRLKFSGKKDGLKAVKVNSFGAAAPHWVDGPTYKHYVHVNDFTPITFGLGDDPKSDSKNAGKNAEVIRFYGDITNLNRDNPEKDWFASPSANHNMIDIYIKAYGQFP
jgi:hypothetical protein